MSSPTLEKIIDLKKNLRIYEVEDELFVVVLNKEEENVRKYDYENRVKFLERLTKLGFSQQDIDLIHLAYDLGKESHRPQIRITKGERYFEHVRRAALILIDECGINDPNIIIAALLHDAVEDAATFGSGALPVEELKRIVYFRLSRIFNEEVAQMVIALSKPKIDGKIIQDKKQKMTAYLHGLDSAPVKTLIVKMADRLDNLRTSMDLSLERKEKIIAETKYDLFPIFQKTFKTYPIQAAKLMNEMETMIEKLEQSLKPLPIAAPQIQ